MRLAPAPPILVSALLLSLGSACGLDGATVREEARVRAVYTLAADSLGTVDGVTLRDGGLSALDIGPDGTLWALTDRGPNLEASARYGRAAKRFPTPDYHPHLLRLDTPDGTLTVTRALVYRLPDGTLATGLPPPARDPKLVVELAVGPAGDTLAPDPDGVDSEGLALGPDGMFYVSEEYRPSIWRLDSTGRLRARYTPEPTAAAGHALPAWLLERRANLGLEGLALGADGELYAALQGPLSPPDGSPRTPFARILRLTLATGRVSYLTYALDGPARKIGDLALGPGGGLLILEHGERREGGGWSAELYALDLGEAAWSAADAPGAELFTSTEEARAHGRPVAPKYPYLDLLAAGWPPAWRKPEGLAVGADGSLLLVNDNDYGLESPGGLGAAAATGVATGLVVIR